MKTIRYTAPRQFAVVDLPRPEPDPHQVVIRVKACGICRTDLTIHDGNSLAKFSLVSGHEFADVIDSVGSAVIKWKVGNRVTANNTKLCGYCEPCHSGKPLYCENFNSHSYDTPGGFTEYVLINHDKVFALSDRLSFGEATFTEPTTRAVRGVDRITPHSGDSILMFGAGPTDVILTQLLRRAGAGRMIIADPHADKLDILRKYGFTDLAIMDKTDPSKHTAEIKAIIPKGLGIVINATGTASVFKSCFRFVHTGNKIAAYSVYAINAKVSVSPYGIFSQEYTILDSFVQTHRFGRVLEYLEGGTVQVKELISHELPLEGCSRGLDYIVQRQARKVIAHPREYLFSVC